MSMSAESKVIAGSNPWKSWLRVFPILGILVLALSAGAAMVKEINVMAKGASPVDEASVLAFTSVKVGSDISRTELSRDVKELEKSGRFSFVAAQIEEMTDGVRVIYVTANPAQIGGASSSALGVVVKPFREASIIAALRLAATDNGDPMSADISGFTPFPPPGSSSGMGSSA